MFRKTNSLFLATITILVLATIYNIYGSSVDVSAYSASITTSGTINLEVSASGNGANVVTDDITINSTCPLGYTLSVKGPTDNTLYKDGNSSSDSKILASSGTKANPLSIMDNKNTWGYATGSNITANSNFIGLTNTAAELTTKSSASATGGDTFSVYYGASVDTTIATGDYKLAESTEGANDNVITYYLTTSPSCDSLYIRYNDNGANSTTKMGNQQISANATEVVPWASNFQRSGYGFAGWSLEALDPEDGDINDLIAAARASGTVMGLNQTIDSSTDPSIDALLSYVKAEEGNLYIDLYAIWIPSEGNIQNWNGCKNMEVGEVTALTDTRDNDTYAIAKLADENCWMIENLRLGSTTAMTLTPSDSNISSNFTLSASTDPTATEWCTTNDAACDDQSILYSGNTTDSVAIMTGADQNIYGYGNYYNWYTATVGKGTYSMTSGSTDGDICPKGWHLPTGDTGGEFSALDIAIGGNGTARQSMVAEASKRWRRYPNNFLYSGGPADSSIYDRSNVGIFWSSTVSGLDDAFTLAFSSIGATPIGATNKHYGFATRCMVDGFYTVSFDANGGTGAMTDQKIELDTATNLMTNAFTAPTGKQFAEWNTKADGTGTSYSNGQSVSFSEGGKMTLYAIWGCPANTICYDGNGNTSSFGMGTQTIATSATSVKLMAPNFAKTDNGFASWNTKPDGTGTNYGPNETLSFAAGKYSGSGRGLQLYARWIPSAGSLQDWTGCSSLASGTVTALKDSRDNNVYAVAKLADGNCWMIENLRLGGNSAISLTTSNTSIIKAATLPKTIANSIGGGVTKITLISENTTSTVATATGVSDKIYAYGNYYSYAAAIGTTTANNTNNSSATTSICPKGWRLPRAGTVVANNDFVILKNAIDNGGSAATSDLKSRQYPVNFVWSGLWYGEDIYSRGTYGEYWSSTAKSSTQAYHFAADTTPNFANTDSNSNKVAHMAVRCMIK